MHRRAILAALGASAAAGLVPTAGRAQTSPVSELRIGYQKNGVLLVAKQQQLLEKRFAAQGITVKWAEFPFGPPLLEALSAGSLDYGTTGDAPPIFAQAARAKLLYAAALPARGVGQSIIVPPDSPLKTLADLRGKKVGVAKASSAHNLLIAALEADGIGFGEITPVYLAPADASAAYAHGAIDAWSIWDPYYAIAELSKTGARELPIKTAARVQNSYFLSNRGFTEQHPEIVAAINDELTRASTWLDAHRDLAAQIFAEATGVSLEAQRLTVARSEFAFGPLTEQVVAQQQAVADRFYKLGLIPKPIAVRDIVWTGKIAA
jgi:sulfonate transport system substrate-binding protein